jgi:hypothetical protein
MQKADTANATDQRAPFCDLAQPCERRLAHAPRLPIPL